MQLQVYKMNILKNCGGVEKNYLINWSPSAQGLELRSGVRADVSGDIWHIPDATRAYSIDFRKLMLADCDHLNAIKRWSAHNLHSRSVAAAVNSFNQAVQFFNTSSFIAAAQREEEIPFSVLSEGQSSLRSDQLWQRHAYRDFYRWCYSQQFPYFGNDVVIKLDNVVVGGNRKGEAVRSADPDAGPLTSGEVAALTAALRAAWLEKTMPIDEQAALWLCLAFGANASQYALMREEDIVEEYLNGQVVATLVSVPRQKKRHAGPRDEFQTRKANRFVGRVIRQLIEENQARFPKSTADEPRPLFRRSTPRPDLESLAEYKWHLQGREFTYLLSRAVKRIKVKSRTGGDLKLSARRLRYSLATRMVDAGASKYALAAALDHSDLQNVDVYFDVDSSIVKHLDAAMAMALGERAHRFASIVTAEEEAVNGSKGGSRRYFGDPQKDVFEPIGTCGHTSFCNINAPYACYLCPRFQAWMDGPHEKVLDALIEGRAKREQLGLDPKIVALEDELITQVASVLAHIAEVRGSRGGEV